MMRARLTQLLTFAGVSLLACAAQAQDLATPPPEISPWTMFLSADIVVKTVMAGLAVASVVTWTVWIAKSLELFAARRRLSQAFEAISQAQGLKQALAAANQPGPNRAAAISITSA